MLGLTFHEWSRLTFACHDSELKATYRSLRDTCDNNLHMSMEWRIEQELSRRARCGWINEKSMLAMIDLRNRQMAETDYQEYKKAQAKS